MHFRGAAFSQAAKLRKQPPQVQSTHTKSWTDEFQDTQTGMLLGIPRSARCVQRFDDSLNSAIHITYRISLRSSSMREPRDPLLKVVSEQFRTAHAPPLHASKSLTDPPKTAPPKGNPQEQVFPKRGQPGLEGKVHRGFVKVWTRGAAAGAPQRVQPKRKTHPPLSSFANDPSAGSPTETLLRLLLPLNDQV